MTKTEKFELGISFVWMFVGVLSDQVEIVGIGWIASLIILKGRP